MSTVQVNLLQNYQSVVIVFIAIEMFGSVGIDNKSSVYVCGGYMVCQDGACYSQSVAVLGGSGLTGVWCGVYSGDTAQSTINLWPAHTVTPSLANIISHHWNYHLENYLLVQTRHDFLFEITQ